MRPAYIIAIAPVFVGTVAFAAHVIRLPAIPEPFWGTWAPSAEACKTEDKSVVITAKTYAGSGKECAVKSVSKTPGAHGSIYSARLHCASATEPTKQVESYLILQSKSENQISAGHSFDSLSTRQRCAGDKSVK